MNDLFVNREDATFLRGLIRGLSEDEWQEFIGHWGKDTPPEPSVFKDGTMYGDCGREVERRMFWLLHKDDHTFCTKEIH